MEEYNPYAPSPASLAGAAATAGRVGGWRDGTVLVLTLNAPLPNRCVKCNEPAEQPTKNRKVYWHNPWLYLLILLNILLYAVVALFAGRKAVIAPGLCSTHKSRRRIGIAIAWALLLSGVALLVWGIGESDGGGAVEVPGGLLLILVAAVVSTIVTPILRAQRIDAQYVRLKGCGTAFLDSMPPFVG